MTRPRLLLLTAPLAIGLLAAAGMGRGAPDENARELGRIAWGRDFEAARAASAAQGKPIFLLFQEVPGCQTCVSFGEEVLSHPLLVEAIEDEFVPLAILNNRGGEDRRVLRRFGEPAWNNPVVRFVDAAGDDLVSRRDRVWRSAEIARRMAAALDAAGRPVPGYLTALARELGPARIERATLAMGCYWAGEACLGGLPGVLSSRTGDLGGREVVEVRYDASRLDYAELLRQARARGCADAVFAHGEAQLAVARGVYGERAQLARGRAREATRRNQKVHLKRARRLASLELTPAQAARLNHAVWAEADPRRHLSPRQLESLR